MHTISCMNQTLLVVEALLVDVVLLVGEALLVDETLLVGEAVLVDVVQVVGGALVVGARVKMISCLVGSLSSTVIFVMGNRYLSANTLKIKMVLSVFHT